ncbi:MAG: GrpB family protein [Gammaproteobacteria bacterium]
MIYLSPYNPEWPDLFAAEKELLLRFAGQYIAVIEHIGSTAIPSISAKPVIDIMIGVNKLSDVTDEAIQALEKQGYNYIKKYEIEMPYRRYFQKNDSQGNRTHQIHLVKIHGDFWNRHLLFRDFLRTHPEDAKNYEKLKLDLANKFDDTNEYAKAKTDFCNKIHAKAIRWKLKI